MIASGIARAQADWPNKSVRYINLFPAGGATDVLSRIVCQELSELTGQQFLVENKGGSGGNVGADAIAKSAPDGYTVGLYSIASHAISPTLYARLPFDAEKDFTPISMLWSVPNIFVIKLRHAGERRCPSWSALVKASPGKYFFGSGGSGTSPHICGEMLKQRAGLDMLHVPYRGGAPAMQDMLAGQLDMMYDNISTPLAQYKAGKVGALAVTSPERSPPHRSCRPCRSLIRLPDHLMGRPVRSVSRPPKTRSRRRSRAAPPGPGAHPDRAPPPPEYRWPGH